jgi:hypothetical protein
MKTTLKKILSCGPCGQRAGCGKGWDRLITNLGYNHDNVPLDMKITFKQILENTDIRDAVWSLLTLPYRDQCLFVADVAELALPYWEKVYPADSRPRECIAAIRQYHAGAITRDELRIYAGADDASYAAAYAAGAVGADAAATAAIWQKIEELFVKYFC